MRTAYLGTDEFSAAVLEILARSEHRPALVISPPPSRSGRGRRPTASPTASRARELDLPLMEAANVNEPEIGAALAEAAPEAVCLCSFGQLVGEELLQAHTFLNVHPSLVPRWRGAAPIERAIMAGDSETGISIMRLVDELDAGPVASAFTRRVEIGSRDDFGALSERLASEGGAALVEALGALAEGRLELSEQDPSEVTYAEKIAPFERLLDPRLEAVALERRVRALTPQIGAYVGLTDGERLGVSVARAVADGPGQGAIEASNGRLVLGCSDGALELLEVRPPGGRAMATRDFLRGHEPPSAARSSD